jgi:hypothetical protein
MYNTFQTQERRSEMSISRLEFEQRLKALDAKRAESREVAQSILGDVSPKNLEDKSAMYVKFASQPGITSKDRDRWLDEHTSGQIERSLVFSAEMRELNQAGLARIDDMLSRFDEIRVDLSPEEKSHVKDQLLALKDFYHRESTKINTFSQQLFLVGGYVAILVASETPGGQPTLAP